MLQETLIAAFISIYFTCADSISYRISSYMIRKVYMIFIFHCHLENK